jgi:hypothetical protein
MSKIIVTGACLIGDCNCAEYDGQETSVAGTPPFHEGCTCYTKGQVARLRISMYRGNFAFTEVTDIETGINIPVRSIRLDMSVDNWTSGVMAIIEVPIEELELDGVLTKIETFEDTT